MFPSSIVLKSLILCVLFLGIYSAGWLSTGPVGVILSTMTNAFETARKVAKDLSENVIDTSQSRPGINEIMKSLQEKG